MTITIEADLHKNILKAFGSKIDISCIVRNEINGWRRSDEVVYSIPDKKPIQPREFPKGMWTIGKPDTRTDPYLAPYFIPTSAWQYLPIWKLDVNKCYANATPNNCKDKGYGLHYSTSTSTQGCIKINKLQDLLWLVTMIKNHQSLGDVVMLHVV